MLRKSVKKKIVIESCKECPYKSVCWNEEKQGYTDYVCRNHEGSADLDKEIPDINQIPKWCPLLDDDAVINLILMPDGQVF